MVRILAIDPSSNVQDTSNTGIVLLDNADLVKFWVVPYGVDNFTKWYRNTGRKLKYDLAVCERFDVKKGDKLRDNSVVDVMKCIERLVPNIELLRNTGYMQDVPDAMLKACELWSFSKSHHNDVRAAARLALFYAERMNIQEVVDAIGLKIISYETSGGGINA